MPARDETCKAFLENRYAIEAVVGTQPIPKKYLEMHTPLGTWTDPAWQPIIALTLRNAEIRASYDEPFDDDPMPR